MVRGSETISERECIEENLTDHVACWELHATGHTCPSDMTIEITEKQGIMAEPDAMH